MNRPCKTIFISYAAIIILITAAVSSFSVVEPLGNITANIHTTEKHTISSPGVIPVHAEEPCCLQNSFSSSGTASGVSFRRTSPPIFGNNTAEYTTVLFHTYCRRQSFFRSPNIFYIQKYLKYSLPKRAGPLCA